VWFTPGGKLIEVTTVGGHNLVVFCRTEKSVEVFKLAVERLLLTGGRCWSLSLSLSISPLRSPFLPFPTNVESGIHSIEHTRGEVAGREREGERERE